MPETVRLDKAVQLLTMPIFVLFVFLAAGLYSAHLWKKRAVRRRCLATPLTSHQRAILMEKVPLFRKAPIELQKIIEGRINLFLHQVKFIGCNDLEVSEEMELTIASQACLMTANNNTWYDSLSTILIYPGAFKSRIQEHDGYVVTESESVRIGESWERGPVILSWFHSALGAFIDDDGHNVVLHEFAHQLDALSGHTDGAPILGSQFTEWQNILNEAYDRLVQDVEMGRATFLDSYGSTAPAEFFAVLVEVFFEKPNDLKQHEPAVYEQMSKFFNLDPSSW